MKIAVAIGIYDPRGGGAERSTSQIVRQLVSRGHEVTVIAGLWPEDVQEPGVRVQSLLTKKPRLSWWVPVFARWARGRIVSGGYDTSLSVATAVPAAVVQPRGGTVRETLERNIAIRTGAVDRLIKRVLVNLSLKQQILLALERRTLRDPIVKHVAAVSQYVADQVKHYGVDPQRVVVIPNAAQMPTVDQQTQHQWRQRVRRGFDVSESSTVYLFAAHNAKLKGFWPLIEATKRLIDQGMDLTLLVAGTVGHGQHALIAQSGIRDRVRIVGTTGRMHELYAAADVTVHPTFYDPSSKVVIESLMMGTPAITTSFNGASDFVLGDADHADRGRVIKDPNDVASLARAMTELADSAARQKCVQAMNGLAQSLSIERHVDQLERVLVAAAQESRL